MKRYGIQWHIFGNALSPNKIDMLNLYQQVCAYKAICTVVSRINVRMLANFGAEFDEKSNNN